MTNSNFDMDVQYVKSLIYGTHGGVSNTTLYHFLTRGIGGVVDFFVARDSEKSLDIVAEKYDLDFKLKGGLHSRLNWYATVDGRRTAQALREQGVIVPQYIEDIVLCEEPAKKPGYHLFKDKRHGRFQIFYVGDDRNAGGMIDHFRQKIQIPLSSIIDSWNLDLFDVPLLKERLALALRTKPTDPIEAQLTDYDRVPVDRLFELMDVKGVVQNLFGNPEWRANAMEYGKALRNAVLQAVEKEMAKGTEAHIEFLEKLYYLYLYYRRKITQ